MRAFIYSAIYSACAMVVVAASPASAAEFVDVTLEKIEYYDQTTASGPTFRSAEGAIYGSSEFIVTGPAGSITDFQLSGGGVNRSTLDAAFPAGDYTFELPSGPLAGQTFTAPLGADWWPAVPTLTPASLNLLASLDGTQDLVLEWDPFVPASSATDAGIGLFVQRTIGDDSESLIFQPSVPSDLSSVTIPAEEVLPGSEFRLILSFSNAVEDFNLNWLDQQHILVRKSAVTTTTFVDFTVLPVPEPASVALLAAALPLVMRRRP